MAAHRKPESTSRRLRWTPLSIVAGLVATAALALSMNGTLAAFTAQITNDKNSVATGSLTMQETYVNGGTTTTCTSNDGSAASVATNTATCSSINKYGGATLVPGGSVSTTVSIRNSGTSAASTFTLTPGTCTPGTATVNGGAADICSKLTLAVYEGSSTTAVASGTLASLASRAVTLSALAAGSSQSYTFTVTLPAGTGNSYQGLTAAQPLVWNFSAGS